MSEHECPVCGSLQVTCKHCRWSWIPRDPENIPDRCPRCRNDWRTPFREANPKYGEGSMDLYTDYSQRREIISKMLRERKYPEEEIEI